MCGLEYFYWILWDSLFNDTCTYVFLFASDCPITNDIKKSVY